MYEPSERKPMFRDIGNEITIICHKIKPFGTKDSVMNCGRIETERTRTRTRRKYNI